MGNESLVCTISTKCELGESPVWDGRIGALWLTDIERSKLLKVSWPSKKIHEFSLPERLGSLGLTSDPNVLVCAYASGFALFNPSNGRLQWLYRTEPNYRGIRMNDGRVDRLGRFWAGSLVESNIKGVNATGALWRIDSSSSKSAHCILSDVKVSNSICFSPDQRSLYFADTMTQEILSFDLKPDGSISKRRVFARLEGEAYPDGSDVDSEGLLWNAEWGSGRITTYGKYGRILSQIELPVSNATCVAFGGNNLDLLFVTTAMQGLSSQQLAKEENAGDLFVFRVPARGLPAPKFAD